MKLQYKSAGLMILSGTIILLFSIGFYSNHKRQVVLSKELNNVKGLSIQVAQHLGSHLISTASIAATISSASDIHEALLKSNLKYETLTIPKREALITLGLKLVRTLVENQLDGSINMESNNGTKFTIQFNIEV